MLSDRVCWAMVCTTCALSLFFNLLALRQPSSTLPSESNATTSRFCVTGRVDDSEYSYVGDDHPVELPLQLDAVALTVEDTRRYGVSSKEAWAEWRSLDHFQASPESEAYHGFVKLGPGNERMFGVSMFHQLHCLDNLRVSIIGEHPHPSEHTHHCLNFLRQMILCAADTTLDGFTIDAKRNVSGTNGLGVTHICRDWTQVYDFMHENQRSWTTGVPEGHGMQ